MDIFVLPKVCILRFVPEQKGTFFFSTSLNFTLILYNGGSFPFIFLHLCHPTTVINSKAKSLRFKLFCFQGTKGVYEVFQ